MNNSHFLNTVGFPFDLNVLDRMQTSYELFNKLGYMIGQFGIIEGCELVGTTVNNGTVFIQGEVFEFRGGELGETVIIVDEPMEVGFQNGAVHNIHSTRYVTFGTGTTTYAWDLFTNYLPLSEIQELLDSKADKTTVIGIQGQINTLITAVATIPKIKISSGTSIITNRTNGQMQDDYTKNYFDITPPVGYTMANLAGFIPSIAIMFWGGNVDGNDTTWCRYQIQTDKIRVTCNNSESRDSGYVNYMAIWLKY
jgi:hypothetical protein